MIWINLDIWNTYKFYSNKFIVLSWNRYYLEKYKWTPIIILKIKFKKQQYKNGNTEFISNN